MHRVLRYFIGTVWFVNGLYCKVLNLVPRHEEIVALILGDEHSRLLTILIGMGEIAIGIAVLSGKRIKQVVIAQMVLVGTMNIIEFTFAHELLLWGRLNLLFASLFIMLLYYYGFHSKSSEV